MTRRRRFPVATFFLPLLAALLAVPFLGVAAQADPESPVAPVAPAAAVGTPADPAAPSDPAVPATPEEVAEEALASVEELVEPSALSAVPAPEGQDLTLALRDLALTQDALPRGQQDQAARLLARPTPTPAGGIECNGKSGLPCYGSTPTSSTCDDGVCVHYTTTGGHRSTAGNAATTLDVLKDVKQRYLTAGYRLPKGDGATGGGTDQFDVYLAELRPMGLYGYCTIDTRVTTHTTAPAYCVLDNDYVGYGGQRPIDVLRVTAAHEYFHAIQFNYDVNEDAWFMEATATWAEDELYTTINDNRQYLPAGPLGQPNQPLDKAQGIEVYGSWIFFRYLSERFSTRNASGGMPIIVRQMWEKASHSGTGARAMNSLQAISSALAERRTSFADQFARFAVANRRPAANYSEGAAYRKAPLLRSFAMSPKRKSAAASVTVKKRAAVHVRYKSKLKGNARLRVVVDVANKAKGGYVYVTIKRKGKAPVVKKVKINKKGKASAGYAFGKKVQWVEFALINAGGKKAKSSISARVR